MIDFPKTFAIKIKLHETLNYFRPLPTTPWNKMECGKIKSWTKCNL